MNYPVVPCSKPVRGIGVGEPVVLLPVEDVLADVALPALPTVRRVARAGLRGVVLEEWARAFPAACGTASGRPPDNLR